MEAGKKRNLRSGDQYDSLFPKANVNDHTVMSNAVVADTVAFIPRVVNSTLQQTAGIAQKLKDATNYETCRNIWNFVYGHIGYRKDDIGYEQIRSPARTWHDRRKGVDCDCYTTFISSILTNLGIRHKLRITKYSRDQFQHIYPIALVNGREVILDCVTDKFDYEVPFSEKKDFPMDLQYLDGLDSDYSYNQLIYGTSGIGELGRLFGKKKKASSGGSAPSGNDGNTPPPSGAKKKKGFKKILNVVNKVNPATLALRNGVLAAMKLNLFNVAKRMRWSYLSPNQAKAKGINMDRWQKLVGVRQKLENIFYGAGGNPDNLKKAMLSGKGNKDNAVHGLDGLWRYDGQMDAMNTQTALPQLLGGELYYSENPMSGLGELGEPVTAATVAAASGAIATIAAAIKKIGDIFGGKGEGSKDFDEAANTENGGSSATGSTKSSAKTAASSSGDNSGAESGNDSGDGAPTAQYRVNSPAANASGAVARSSIFSPSTGGSDTSSGGSDTTSQDSGSGTSSANTPSKMNSGDNSAIASQSSDNSNDANQSLWEKNKKWIVPAGIGVGVLTALVIGYKLLGNKPSTAASSKPMHGLSHKKNHHRKSKKTKSSPKKAAVVLL